MIDRIRNQHLIIAYHILLDSDYNNEQLNGIYRSIIYSFVYKNIYQFQLCIYNTVVICIINHTINTCNVKQVILHIMYYIGQTSFKNTQ